MFRSLDRAYTRGATWFLALSVDARIVVAGFLVIVMAVCGFYAVLLRAQTHENTLAIGLMKQQLEAEIAARTAMTGSFQSQLNEIGRTVWGDPSPLEKAADVAARKPLQLEGWMLNRDKEFKDHFGRIDKALLDAGLTGRR